MAHVSVDGEPSLWRVYTVARVSVDGEPSLWRVYLLTVSRHYGACIC